MVKNYSVIIKYNLLLILFFLVPKISTAQCAGNDIFLEICDIPNPTSQSIALFPLLGVGAASGGVWTDDDNSGGLDLDNGVLNAQAVLVSGIYHYTYTVLGSNGCTDNSATIEVVIGGYAGVAEKALACSDDYNFNLFQIFDGSNLSPQSNGKWFSHLTGTNVGNVIDAHALGLGTFQFTYSIAAIGNCPAVSSTGLVTVYRSPEPGTPSPLIVCDSDDLSVYSNLDLHDRLGGEDMGGTWKDDNSTNTGQITFLKDHNVDVQYIYNNFGIGNYTFTYTVLPTSPICDIETATVRIRIEKRLDFTGALLDVQTDICESAIPTATYTATLTQGIQNIPNGQYYVTYTVSGPNGVTNTILSTFNNGVLTFPLSRNLFQQPGNFTVAITNIVDFYSEGGCTNIINNLSDVLRIYKTPVLAGAILTPTSVCQNKSSQVLISNATGVENGTYTILYTISGANTVTSQTETIDITGGNGMFTIPSNFNANSGTSVITITNITNTITPYCTNTASLKGNLIIRPLPDVTNLKIEVLDDCSDKPFTASLTGLGTLTDVTISYLISGSNTSTLQTVTLTVAAGKANFVIPAVLLPNTGSNTISVTNLINNDTTCDVNLTTITDTFSINTVPVAPIALNDSFCKIDGATIANLQPVGAQYKWYNSVTLTAALPATYVLKSEDYWVTETSVKGCVSPATKISIIVNDSPAPLLDTDGQNFCGLETPTILDLSNKTNIASTVVWYDALTNGNLLTSTASLTDNTTYYGFDFLTSTGCISEDHLEVTVSLSHCDDTEYATFFVPDGFSPNGDNVNDTFTIPKIDFLYPNYTLEIYNRYGNILFKGNKNKPDWDGSNSESTGFGGGTAPNGVYFYIINFNKDQRAAQQGRLYLNR